MLKLSLLEKTMLIYPFNYKYITCMRLIMKVVFLWSEGVR
ncbi:MAG: hypothetical protein PWR15_529 [Bacteroidota bacterium]|jgi:hypothetical protein|nr:hypothetical protein [Bacteroidota bacterium]